MTLEGELRDVLAEQADRRDGPVPDLAALRAGGLTLRRRRRRLVVASSALAVLLCVGVGVGLAAGQRDTARTAQPAAPSGRGVRGALVRPRPDRGVEQLIEGEGPPIRHPVPHASASPGSGTTPAPPSSPGAEPPTGSPTAGSPRWGGAPERSAMSHDGRLAAWMDLSTGRTSCGRLPLEVYEVATATAVATTALETRPCGRLAGIDDRGRVYVTVSDGRPGRARRPDVRHARPVSGRGSPTCPSPRATASSPT